MSSHMQSNRDMDGLEWNAEREPLQDSDSETNRHSSVTFQWWSRTPPRWIATAAIVTIACAVTVGLCVAGGWLPIASASSWLGSFNASPPARSPYSSENHFPASDLVDSVEEKFIQKIVGGAKKPWKQKKNGGAKKQWKLVKPGLAKKRWEKMGKMGIQGDLRELIKSRFKGGKGGAAQQGGMGIQSQHGLCHGKASDIFTELFAASGLDSELNDKETAAFKRRFVRTIGRRCNRDPEFAGEDWLQNVADEFDRMKPPMTQAFADHINSADLGFQVAAPDWLVEESVEDASHMFGRTAIANATNLKVLPRRMSSSDTVNTPLPDAFDAREGFPECKDVIDRVANQGVCGSCWAFAGTSVVDSRLCIHTRGSFSSSAAELSVGFATSCSVDYNGCEGGWEYFVYQYIEQQGGIPTSSCTPYFGSGEGTDHLTDTSVAPACPKQCDSYERTIEEDKFRPTGMYNYNFLPSPDDDLHAMAARAIYTKGPITFGIYANAALLGYQSGIFNLGCGEQANHAVVAIGWGEGYVIGTNSWGEHWGEDGHFRVVKECVTDYTIPGDITEASYPLPLPGDTTTTTTSTSQRRRRRRRRASRRRRRRRRRSRRRRRRRTDAVNQ